MKKVRYNCLTAVVIGTGSDYFVDIPVVTVDTGGAPCGAPFYGRLRVRATPFFAPVWVSGIVVLANDGGHADGQKEEGEDALHDDDELLRSGKLENVIEKNYASLRFNEL